MLLIEPFAESLRVLLNGVEVWCFRIYKFIYIRFFYEVNTLGFFEES